MGFKPPHPRAPGSELNSTGSGSQKGDSVVVKIQFQLVIRSEALKNRAQSGPTSQDKGPATTEQIARMLSVPEREHKSQDMVAVQQELDHRLIRLTEPLVPNKPEPLDLGSKPEPLINMLCD